MIGRVTQFSLPSMPENRNALQLLLPKLLSRPARKDEFTLPGYQRLRLGRPTDLQLARAAREPPVVAPKRGGFGSRLLSATFANTRCHFDRNGVAILKCHFERPRPWPSSSKPAGDLAYRFELKMPRMWGVILDSQILRNQREPGHRAPC